MEQKNLLIIIVAIICAATVAGVGVYFWQTAFFETERLALQGQIDQLNNQITQLLNKDDNKEDNKLSQYNTKYYEYRLENIGDWSASQDWDQKITRINRQTQAEEIIIGSIKSALPDLQDHFNSILQNFSQPLDSDQVFFTKVMWGTDNPARTYYSFNVNNHKFTKMKINDLDRVIWSFGAPILSPDYKYFVWAPIEAETVDVMYLVDLINDEYSTLALLNKGETLDGNPKGTICGIGSCAAHTIEWADEHTIRYAVYNKDSVELIEFREVSIK